MKRALAQRAKESGMTNGVGPSSPKPPLSIKTQDHSSEGQSSVSDRPEKPLSSTPTSRLEALKQSSRSVSSPRPNSSSPRPKKRARESIVKLEEEAEDDSNASSFYLRHQNRALASELRMLQYELSRLERERDYRRAQCTKAVQILNSLQATWTQMESALQCGQSQKATPSEVVGNDAPPSTGSGNSVELIGALLNSLAALGRAPSGKKGRIRDDGEEENGDVKPGDFMDEIGSQQLDDLLRITDNVSERAQILQKWIWAVLQEVSSSTNARQIIDLNRPGTEHEQKVANLKAKNSTLKAQIKELSTSRDEMSKSDKRVRRGLYRLAAGRVKLKEVLKEIVVTDEDKEAAARWMEEAPVAPAAQNSTATTELSTDGADGGNKPADTAAMAALSKKVDELQEIAKARDSEIKKLLEQKEEQVKKINSLMLKAQDNDSKSLSEQQVRQSDLYAELTAKLLASERKAQSTEDKLGKLTKEWGQAMADTQAAQKAMEDMQLKHLKKWKDFSDDAAMDVDENGDNSSRLNDAEEVIKLQHKLKQAIENVRQAETTRKALDEAVMMNQNLQSKLDEVKSKYSALQASRSNSGNGSNSQQSLSAAASTTGPSTPKPKHSSSGSSSTPSGEKSESSEKHDRDPAKLHKDYRKVRKELAAAIASKEATKGKLTASERERLSLSAANTRLLKQAAERDDVNAKSLSTILHLKQLTDQMSKEKANLENQIKSSQQVALAARLAANARERVTEEFEKARKQLAIQMKEWEEKFNNVSNEKEMLEGQLAKQKAVMASAMKDAEKSKMRCDELVAESTKLEDEKRQFEESLAVAKRELAKAASASSHPRNLVESALSGTGSSSSGFTVDQLSTQVSVLKNRLFCPVCNVRDKNCILLRCRHMFCRHCVDENIRNRSRKCPACGSRFDTKDVAEIWL